MSDLDEHLTLILKKKINETRGEKKKKKRVKGTLAMMIHDIV